VGSNTDQETPEEEDSDDESRTPFVKSHDNLHSWVNSILPFSNDEVEQAPESPETEDLHLSQLSNYEQFVCRSDAYRWLLSKICQHGRLSFGSPNVMSDIGTRILNQLQVQKPLRTMSRHKPLSLANMTFHLEWNLKAHASGLEFYSSSSNILDNILCLTGTCYEAQILTVSEYIYQTWPVTGESIKSILQKLLMIPEGQECTRKYREIVQYKCAHSVSADAITGTKDAHLSARLESKELCTITVTAGAHLISEFAELIAWLAATLRPYPQNEGITICRPHIQSLSVRSTPYKDPAVAATGTCFFSFKYEDKTMYGCNKSGLCWKPLFRNALLVSGFPILRRPGSEKGLEMSLGTISYLIQSDQLVQCGEMLMIKSFSSLLIATFITTDIIVWHLFTSRIPGERISYFDKQLGTTNISHNKIPLLRRLEALRHIVGWCAKATDFCGE